MIITNIFLLQSSKTRNSDLVIARKPLIQAGNRPLTGPATEGGLAAGRAQVLNRAEHRVVRLYTTVTLNNAPIDFIFGVDKLYAFVRDSTMMHLIIFIISI